MCSPRPTLISACVHVECARGREDTIFYFFFPRSLSLTELTSWCTRRDISGANRCIPRSVLISTGPEGRTPQNGWKPLSCAGRPTFTCGPVGMEFRCINYVTSACKKTMPVCACLPSDSASVRRAELCGGLLDSDLDSGGSRGHCLSSPRARLPSRTKIIAAKGPCASMHPNSCLWLLIKRPAGCITRQGYLQTKRLSSYVTCREPRQPSCSDPAPHIQSPTWAVNS